MECTNLYPTTTRTTMMTMSIAQMTPAITPADMTWFSATCPADGSE